MPRYLNIGAAGEVKLRSLPCGNSTPTPAEVLLWNHLRPKQLLRTYSLGKCVVDFYCHECLLRLSLDGHHHYEACREDYEAERRAYSQAVGIKILPNSENKVYEDLEGVLGGYPANRKRDWSLTSPAAPILR